MLGVRYVGTIGGRTTYLSTTDKGLTGAIWPQENVSFSGPMVKVQADPAAEMLATVTLPFVDPEAGTALNTASRRFGAILPPPNRGRIRE